MLRAGFAGLLCIFLSAGVAHAASFQVFTDRALFDAALAARSLSVTTDAFATSRDSAETITFDSGVASSIVNNAGSGPLANSNRIAVAAGASDGVYQNQIDSRNLLDGRLDTSNQHVQWVFPASIFAFGADFDLGFNPNPGTIANGGLRLFGRFEGNDARQTVDIDQIANGFRGFVGVLADNSFRELAFSTVETNRFQFFSVRNLSFGTENPVSAVPIPAPALLLLTAIAGLFGTSRIGRRRS